MLVNLQVPSMSTPEPLREIGQIADIDGAVELYTIRWSDSTEGIRVSRSKIVRVTKTTLKGN